MTALHVARPDGAGSAGAVQAHAPSEVAALAARLRAAQPAWEAAGPARRGEWLAALRDWILDHEQRLLDLIRAETGKAEGDAVVDVLGPLDIVNHYVRHGAAYLADARPPAHALFARKSTLAVRWRPFPLAGVISPWNFPLGLSLMDAVPALVAGCAVLVKPSELTPLTVTELARAWREDLGAPDVLAAVNGGAAAGEAVVDVVDYVHFTGSTATGRRVMERAARRLTPVSLELGGKDAMIVCDDADVERAANGAVWGGMLNAGQTCVSVERVYVEPGIYDAFVERVVAKTRALRVGADVGALASEDQARLVTEHVDEAVALGATVRCGGGRLPRPGKYFAPTVLTGVDHRMRCMTEETFGPTLPIMRVADVDEAVALANASAYGLSASVWTADRAKGRAIARRVEAGAVNVNDVIGNLAQVALPMGGWKQSGLGTRFGGAHGVRRYCRAQAVATARLPVRSEPNWYPYSAVRSWLVRRGTRLLFARGRRRVLR